MRSYYKDNFNEDYELGYERGRRDALRELRESKEESFTAFSFLKIDNVAFVKAV